MAEGVGFEPTVRLPVHGISSAAPSAARPPLRVIVTPEGAIKLAEGRGFEPPRDSRPYPISSRTPSTGLGHPSASGFTVVHHPLRTKPLGPPCSRGSIPAMTNRQAKVWRFEGQVYPGQ